jgi:hypothetical protein
MLFDKWDEDGGGHLAVSELSRILSGSRRAGQSSIDLDEGPDARPVSEQLAEALRSSSGKVVDLFRSWDANGDGNISRKEFHKAMKVLGYDVGKKAIDQLFDEWDVDGGGELGLKEMQKILAKASPKIRKAGRAALVVGKSGNKGTSGGRSPSPSPSEPGSFVASKRPSPTGSIAGSSPRTK